VRNAEFFHLHAHAAASTTADNRSKFTLHHKFTAKMGANLLS
jgi:hypothetical protein